jgi:hypothetical protein
MGEGKSEKGPAKLDVHASDGSSFAAGRPANGGVNISPFDSFHRSPNSPNVLATSDSIVLHYNRASAVSPINRSQGPLEACWPEPQSLSGLARRHLQADYLDEVLHRST